MLAVVPPPVRVVPFAAAQHNASLVIRPPRLGGRSKLEIVISSPHNLRRGPVKYEGGAKQQKLAATVFPFDTTRHFFQAGLALNAGGGTGCVVRAHQDVCYTLMAAGFLRVRHVHWRKLKITIFKPARQPTQVRLSLRALG